MTRNPITRSFIIAFAVFCLASTNGYSQNQPANTALSSLDQNTTEAEHAWLNTATGKELAFYLSETSGKAHGGVLIVPDNGRHPAKQGDMNTLRHTLANNHWHTLAVDISHQDPATIQQTIAAGIVFLNGKGVFNIAVLGEGQGAAHALHYVAKLPPVEEGKIQQIRALLMINAHNRVPGLDGNTMAPLATLNLPVLDAYAGNNYRTQQQAAERKKLSLRKNSQYQQARLPYTSNQDVAQENRVTKRIRGWLDKNVAGFMVDSR